MLAVVVNLYFLHITGTRCSRYSKYTLADAFHQPLSNSTYQDK